MVQLDRQHFPEGNGSRTSINYPMRVPFFMDSITVLAFDPNNEDILYLELFEHIMTCNIREKKLKDTLTTMYKSMVPSGVGVFLFVLPKWPTPLPRPR